MKVNNQSNDVQSIIVVHVFRNAAAEMIDCNDKSTINQIMPNQLLVVLTLGV